MFKKILLVLIAGLLFFMSFVNDVSANVFYEVSFLSGVEPSEVFYRETQYQNGTGIKGHGFYEIPMKYGLYSITPIEGKENFYVLQFTNSNEPLYLGRLLKTNEYILEVKLLKIISRKLIRCEICKRLRRSANKDGICDECFRNQLFRQSK